MLDNSDKKPVGNSDDITESCKDTKEKCPFCKKEHLDKKNSTPTDSPYKRDDNSLTEGGRIYIKKTSSRNKYYPKVDNKWCSPIGAPEYTNESRQLFTKEKDGKTRAQKYQPPPIAGYVAAPHHMIALYCMNGPKGKKKPAEIRAWAKKAGYDINRGENCIFLPSSASQFFLAYYYWKEKRTGQALQGHLGAHRKAYFTVVSKK